MASSYQTLNDIFADIRYIVGKDSTTLPDSVLLRLANKYFLLLVREYADLNEQYYAQISHSDIEAGKREYQLPVDDQSGSPSNGVPYGGGAVNIMRVEVTYDGSNWYKATAIEMSDIKDPHVTDSDLNEQFEKTSPVYWFFDRSLFLAPVPSATDAVTNGNNGMYIWYVQRPKELGAVSGQPSSKNYDEVIDLPKDYLSLLTEGILIDIFRKYGRYTDMQRAQALWANGVEAMRSTEAGPDYESPLTMKPLYKNYS